MTKFVTSKFGWLIVSDEEYPNGFPFPRYIFIVTMILIHWLIILGIFFKYRNSQKFSSSSKIVKCLMWSFIFSLFAHTTHFVHNTIRPIECHEPRFFYLAYFWSEMELTYYGYLLTSISGFYGVSNLLSSEPQNQKNGLKCLLFYCLGCYGTLWHYVIDPIWEYELLVNLGVLADGILAIILNCAVLKFWNSFDRIGKQGKVAGISMSVKYSEIKQDTDNSTTSKEHLRRRSGSQNRDGNL